MGLGQGAGLNLIWCIVLSRGSGTLQRKMQLAWVEMRVGGPMEVKKRGAPLKPAHSDPLKQAKREKERLARQGSRERAAQRAVVAKETRVPNRVMVRSV